MSRRLRFPLCLHAVIAVLSPVNPRLQQQVDELSKVAEPLPLEALRKYLAEATHRCELAIGERPSRWSVLFNFGVLWGIKLPDLDPDLEAILDSLRVPRLGFFPRCFAFWELSGQKTLNPFEPMVQICRHGGLMWVAGDGALDLRDHAGNQVGIPIASTFRWERLT